MHNCLFCKIARKEITSKIVLESPDWICFEDTSPKAPVHMLLIPKNHYSQLHKINDETLMAKLMLGIKQVVTDKKLIENGYRVVTNAGSEGGQSVDHVHFHIFAGRKMGWPPG